MTPNDNDLKYFRPRRELVELLRSKGIRDESVLQAIERIPRHRFIDPALGPYAYEDRPLPIGSEQTISQPFTVAYMTQLLDLKPGMKVLEIGTGSGYQTAVLLEMGARVYSVERIKSLYEETKERLEALGYYPERLVYGDGYKGLPAFAPYDRIIVTAAAPYVPPALVEQLAPGGKMVIPVGKGTQDMWRIIKDESGNVMTEKYEKFAFVPLKPGKA
ncbi:MAG: protein-L-isoaspartate(D-aspartate) O-methyltransferase [Chlorobi bacterium]|nr:protein-L-isoaspartate(D-aspartate) O-methyltransferase [Chlorobiota bacterium]